MAIFVSYGICSAFGVPYGPVHSILPFLLLGIGIDDMFVIVQCWNNLTSEDIKNPLHVRIGTALKHAGVSITITSITDFAAFAVGSSTVSDVIGPRFAQSIWLIFLLSTSGFAVVEIILHLLSGRYFGYLHLSSDFFCSVAFAGSKEN